MAGGDRGYAQRLGEILRQRDPGRLREFLVEQASRFGDERQVEDIRIKSRAELETLMHRMIVARPDLSDLHPKSRQWLARIDER